jgi:alpha-L-fucosidase
MDDGGKSGMEVLAHYYNHNASKHKGRNEGVMVIKDITRHGYFYPGVSSIALERQYSDSIQKNPQVTDESIGPWFHTGTNAEYKSSRDIINLLADVVSKNCNFLLNIPPRADGTFDEAAITALNEIGDWMKVNGSAIYATRPWKTFGEGSVRFTTKKDTLNAILRQSPKNIVFLGSFKGWKTGDIKKIELLGSNSKIEYRLNAEGLLIIPPKSLNSSSANVFKITCRNLASLPSTKVSLESTKKLNDDAEKKYGADGHGNSKINN